jgi:choline-sulfatase/uncharacterized sulfatase
MMSDQHNAKVLGHKGHPDVKTPNLDRLASEGVRFETCITQNPICTPTRISILSGQYCHNHGYYGLSGPRPRGLPTVLGHFRRAGYLTAAIGKIHCPEYWVEDDCDVYRETGGCSIGGPPEYSAYLKEKGAFELRDFGGFPEFGERGRQAFDARASKMAYEDSPEGWIVRESAGFMGRASREGRPFFCHASFPKPHQMYAPAEEFWNMYDEQKISLPPNADYEMALKAPNMRRMAEEYRKGDWTLFEPRTFEAGRRRKLRGYLGCVTHVDRAVGDLVAWLDEEGLGEDTVVIYTTDHGDYACEHGMMEKAPGICSDAITRVPSIWRWTGRFRAGHVAREIVEAVDLPNTLASLAGLEPLETADGRDVSHLLRGEPGEVRRIGVTEFAWSKSVRRGRHRYVYYPREMFAEEFPEGFGELYDLERDPWEMENLCFRPEYADLVRELKDELLDWLVTTSRPATVNPAVRFAGRQSETRYHNSVNADGRFHPDWIRRWIERGGVHRNYV